MQKKKKKKGTLGEIVVSTAGKNPRHRILIATPTLGLVRMEWANVRYGQIIPTNWSCGHFSAGLGCIIPMYYLVADAQNVAVKTAVEQNYEWLLFWEDDVMPPLDLFPRLNKYIRKADIPVVSGLYYLKNPCSEPVVYRGSGVGCYDGFKLGTKFWVDGVPTGMLLIHMSILKLMYGESEEYEALGAKTRRVFESPAQIHKDRSGVVWASSGTSDLAWCKRVIKENVLKRAGWPKIGRKKYPFLVDSTIFCKHIDLTTGKQYPL